MENNKNIVDEIKKESKDFQILLIAALVVFISCFLPWFTFSSVYYSVSVNGLRSWGMVNFISAILCVLYLILPKLGVIDLKNIQVEPKIIKGVFSIVCLVSTLIFIFSGSLSNIGVGAIISVLGSLGMLYAVYIYKK